jgi:hypothetical protein
MIPINKDIECPLCGKSIKLQPKPGDYAHLVATCDCGTGHYRNVMEIDDPNYRTLEERLEPGEPPPPINWKRSKKP